MRPVVATPPLALFPVSCCGLQLGNPNPPSTQFSTFAVTEMDGACAPHIHGAMLCWSVSCCFHVLMCPSASVVLFAADIFLCRDNKQTKQRMLQYATSQDFFFKHYAAGDCHDYVILADYSTRWI